MVRIPETVRAKAVAAGATRWLDDLPSLVASLESDWSLTIGRVYPEATEAFVAEATIGDATPAVLKLLVPRDGEAAVNAVHNAAIDSTRNSADGSAVNAAGSLAANAARNSADGSAGNSAGSLAAKAARNSADGSAGNSAISSVANVAVNEITALRLAGGGCVELLRHDEARGALLLERLGPSLYELALPIRRRHEILCSVARRVWRPAPGCGLPTGADKGRWLMRFITTTWQDLDGPCARRTVEHALACAERRIAAHRDERAVLVHGDVHQWNALQAGDGFKLVDPDGLLAEAEYDLGIIMREDPVELVEGNPHDRARWLAARTGLDPIAIWEWGVVERVSTGLVCASIDLQPIGRQMLAAADRIAVHNPGPP